MTANQRRPGFRLPWSPEEGDQPQDAAGAFETDAPAAAGDEATPVNAKEPEKTKDVPDSEDEPSADVDTTTGEAPSESAPDFMRDLVAAMRKVADEARQAGITDLRGRADQRITRLEADADQRRDELRTRAEVDIAGVAEWASAEAERIRAEAEQRAAARRAQLEQQLLAETARAEGEALALRERVTAYERELGAFHAQLEEIEDPAAFAAAAKRIPRPPQLDAGIGIDRQPGQPEAVAAAEPDSTSEVHPAEEEVLASRLAELDEDLAANTTTAAPSEGITTEIVVKGLGSFGAITGFRQALAGVDGIEGVALSLGQSGEFVFRATHRSGFDPAAAIIALEGDAAKTDRQADGALVVTLDRPR